VGEEYETVITTFGGLYRYRLGDVVKVMGFHNSTPELKFVCRRNLMLSINIDKNTEKDLQLAVEKAEKVINAVKLEVVDFTSHADLSTDPGHYVIFWELNGEASQDVLQECCNCLDRSFVDAGYVSSRKVKGIGPLELRILQRGTFQKIVDHYVGMGAAVSQFKTPRCVGPMNNVVFQILCTNVVNNCFSTAY
ncbi:jasmonoyl--L-amino acid synthetase JAR4-like, partial [Rutidosis leptorrhynchoides]|uniref:jasmonoyl--L-amino acid synthetase JAR4-like n=1 Tax=Rutidosis leptorrhynchoides TaxID=125765 RepID=UPI003A9A1EB2